ncbi:MAG: CinA family protein [Bacilli bacterium]
MKEVIELLTKKHKKISTMESCTGGGVANAITNIEGASNVLEFSAVTYSNEYKIKMGVDKDIIEKYSVYSLETAKEMSKNISDYTNANYGIGITGKMNKEDINNPYGENNKIFISIYDRDNNKYYNKEIIASQKTRKENKELVINEIIYILNNILK